MVEIDGRNELQVMEELHTAFSGWTTFRDTLCGLSKAFGSYHRLGRFREVCIEQNPNIDQAGRPIIIVSIFLLVEKYGSGWLLAGRNLVT